MIERELLKDHLIDCVDQAIAEGWVRPHYQAIVRAATGYLCGEEVLARWNDPEYGELLPDAFVPVLEEAGLLYKLDMHMVDCVLEDIVAKREAGMIVVPVSVNVSLRNVGELDVAEELARRADDADVPHGLLRVEFTEAAAFEDPDSFNAQVKSLRDAGFEVWLDDFGSGYSSFGMLRNHVFDLIKLDTTLIGSLHDEGAFDIVASIVHVAKKLGVGVLAEGVETEQQALFLESIGCGMLQGFHFAKPVPFGQIMDDFSHGRAKAREEAGESDYWEAVGSVDLLDLLDLLSGIDNYSADGAQLTGFPAGVMERRGDEWFVLRANAGYRALLAHGGVVPLERSNLEVNTLDRGIDIEYATAAAKSTESGSWERVAGRLEYGTGFQFYTRPLASTSEADAFALASVPNMLGTALGTYGDVPVAYAVLRVKLAGAGNAAVDAEYVYANSMFCNLCGYSKAELPGKSFLKMALEVSREWLPYFYRAAVLKEEVHDVKFSAQVDHWLSFNVSPSPVRGCCVFAFTIADAERRERDEIMIGRNTSDFIVSVANAFDKEKDYRSSMNAVLEMMSHAIHPKRLFIYERGQGTDLVTFEWCDDVAYMQAYVVQDAGVEDFAAWDNLAEGDTIIYIPDVAMLESTNESLYRKLVSEGVTHVLAVQLYDGDTIVGNLVAENYELDESVDTKRVLETVATFISSRIVNNRLLSELERLGIHDSLTGLLNRRGFDRAISERMEANPDEPFVLALMDIDDFKTVNDLHGHDVGDAVLRSLAEMVRQGLPAGAVVGRNGGDEFAIMLFGYDCEGADDVFASLAEADLGCVHGGKRYGYSISIGYAGWPDQAATLNDAYSKADAALYAVKLADKAASMRYIPEVEAQYRSQLGFTPRDIAENIPGAIMVHRAGGDGEILFANDELVSLFECDDLAEFMEHTGGTFAGVVHPDDGVRVYEELTTQLSLDDIGGKNYSNYRIITKKGNVRNVENNGRLVDIAEVGKVFYVLMVNQDERNF